jgi:hypothetical protein
MGKKGGPWGLAQGTSPKKGIRIPGETLIPRISLSAFAFILISACFIILIPRNSPATEVTIAWSPSPDSNVAGYKVYYGPTSRDNQYQVDVGKNTSITISNVQEGGAYSFVVITYDSAGRESRHSSKATVSNLRDKDTHFLPTIPSSPPSPPGAPGPLVQEKTFPDTPPGCQFAILPASQTIDSSGGWGTVGMSARPDCPWSAISNAPWMTITSNSSGAGEGVVYYLVKANPGASSRDGTLTVAGKTFRIIQTGRERYALKVTQIGTGSGTVTLLPAGANFEAGTTVILSAVPSHNSNFVGWSGRCSGRTPTCSVTVDSNSSVNAAFKLKTFVIAATAGGNGSISPSGHVVVNHGGSQKFIFKPNKGYQVGQVRVDGVPVGNPETLLFGNVMSSHRIEAIFLPLR